MNDRTAGLWPLGRRPTIGLVIPDRMHALTIHRDDYGPPADVIRLEDTATPGIHPEIGTAVLVAVLASGPNFNTNFAALGLPVPVFGRGDSATLHIPGSDALGIVVDAGPGVKNVRVGQAVILDSWTSSNTIRGYETHDGFNAQFALVEQERAIPVPAALAGHSPEQLAALLLTYGTAYRAVVERLAVRPGDAVLLMGGGKGTSYAGAQIARALGARVILVGSNRSLGQSLIERGIADAFIDRRSLPADVFGVIPNDLSFDEWQRRTDSFRQAVHEANFGRPVDKIFEHTGGKNFPLLVSALSDNGTLAFFGATGGGLKGEYKQTFFYAGRRFVVDARWVWMRQKQIIFRRAGAREIFSEIRLPPGRKGLVWGADEYALEFVAAALERSATVGVIASRTREAAGIAALERMGLAPSQIIDRDAFSLPEDMPDPLTDDGRSNPAYGPGFMEQARALGRAAWELFGPRTSPDFVVDRPDQSTLHFSSFLARDYDERDELQCGWVIVRGPADLSILGSHMYRSGQAREVVRLLAESRIVMEQEDLEITTLGGLREIQQKMLDGRMEKPKGVALVQADEPGQPVQEYEAAYLGDTVQRSAPELGCYTGLSVCEGVAIVSLDRPETLNALSPELVAQLAEVVDEVERRGTLGGRPVRALLLRSAGRAFMAGADVTGFYGNSAAGVSDLATRVLALFARLEALPVPVVSLVDGFALGGGNELAMSTHYRIVTENALMGQPEIKLGIFPGYGGMQRLPRLVGPRRAAEIVLNGEPVGGRTAVAIGLADEFQPAASALRAAFSAARRMAAGNGTVPRRVWDGLTRPEELRSLWERPEIAELSRATAPNAQEAGDLGAARRYAGRMALEALRFGHEHGFRQGIENDARLFGELTASPSGQYWIGRFLAKDPRQSAFLTLLPAPSAQ